jgi:hypothetical protein
MSFQNYFTAVDTIPRVLCGSIYAIWAIPKTLKGGKRK